MRKYANDLSAFKLLRVYLSLFEHSVSEHSLDVSCCHTPSLMGPWFLWKHNANCCVKMRSHYHAPLESCSLSLEKNYLSLEERSQKKKSEDLLTSAIDFSHRQPASPHSSDPLSGRCEVPISQSSSTETPVSCSV